MTTTVHPSCGTPDDWRGVIQANARLDHVRYCLASDETWLPHILVQAGFFPSGNEVKKNRPDLWRDRTEHDAFKTSWATVVVVPLSESDAYPDPPEYVTA